MEYLLYGDSSHVYCRGDTKWAIAAESPGGSQVPKLTAMVPDRAVVSWPKE